MLVPSCNLKAIFFDLDDTLCNYSEAAMGGRRDSFELIRQIKPELTIDFIYEVYWTIFQEMVTEVRKPGTWRERYLKCGASSRDETMTRTVKVLGIDDELLGERVSSLYDIHRRKRLRLYPDVLLALKLLHDHYFLGIITNGPADVQRDELATLQINEFFSCVFIEGEFGLGKPDPKIFLAALEAADAKPEEAIFIGDSRTHDIAGAKMVGINTIWINREGVPSPEDQIKPDLEIKNLQELVDWLRIPCV